jgi:hypothetical protein
MQDCRFRYCCAAREARNAGKNSVIIPCKFPGRMKMSCVYAGFAIKFFLAGKNSLFNSLRREFASDGSTGSGSSI